MCGVAIPEPNEPRWAKPVSSRTIATTFGAPAGGFGSSGGTGVESATVKPSRCGRGAIESETTGRRGRLHGQPAVARRRGPPPPARGSAGEDLHLGVRGRRDLQPPFGGVLDEGDHPLTADEARIDASHGDLDVTQPDAVTDNDLAGRLR